MEFSKLLFTYDEQFGCLLFNEITLLNLVKKTNENYQDYLVKWFNIIYKNDLKPIKIIGLIENDQMDYPLLINEKNKEIKLFNETIDFESKYKEFIESNDLWDGQIYKSYELDLNYWTAQTKPNQLKHTIRDIDKKTHNNVELLDYIINATKDEIKKKYYQIIKASLIAKRFKCALTNYKKINLNKFIIPIYVTSYKLTESRLSDIYSEIKIEIVCDINQSNIDSLTSFSVTYSKVMVDDGHDYYSSHTHTPKTIFDYGKQSPFTELYMKHCFEFIIEKFC